MVFKFFCSEFFFLPQILSTQNLYAFHYFVTSQFATVSKAITILCCVKCIINFQLRMRSPVKMMMKKHNNNNNNNNTDPIQLIISSEKASFSFSLSHPSSHIYFFLPLPFKVYTFLLYLNSFCVLHTISSSYSFPEAISRFYAQNFSNTIQIR